MLMREALPQYIRSLNGLEPNPRGKKALPLVVARTMSVERFVEYPMQGRHSIVVGIDGSTILKMQRETDYVSAREILNEHRLLHLVRSPYVVPSSGLVSTVIGTSEHLGFLMPRLEKPIFGELPRGELFRCITQLGESVDFIHTKGVTHADIHDDNILYDPSIDRYRLTDFSTGDYSNKRTCRKFRDRCISDRTYFVQTMAEMAARNLGLTRNGRKTRFPLGEAVELYSSREKTRQFLLEYRKNYGDFEEYTNMSKLAEAFCAAINEDFPTE